MCIRDSGFLFLCASFLIYVWLAITDNFSVQYIASHSNSELPLFYKISSIWSAHEGSMFLWIVFLSVWGFIFNIRIKNEQILKSNTIGVISLILVGFLLFLLVTSNPFATILPVAPQNGADINPVLQDPALAIHPPTLYLGYVGFVIPFACAISFLINGDPEIKWEKLIRKWSVLACVFLTVGITLGSWWAYYELGWGGWWAWDPVENPPMITWLFGTALIHSLAVTEKRGMFKSWTVLLAILAFSGSLLGTFITRSGLLTSVHAFASDPSRGFFILGILGISIGGSLLLYALRAPFLKGSFSFEYTSREFFLLVNNVILVVSAASIFLGTLFPMVYQAVTDDLISIGPPYFNTIFVPLMMLLFVFVGIGPLSRWKRTSWVYLAAQLGKVFFEQACRLKF